jgi:hypothetical protein
MFVIDYEQILQQVRKQSFEYFTRTAKEMLVFWFEDACKDDLFDFPVVYISLTFKGFNYEEGSLIFTSDPPELINEKGILDDSTYHIIQNKIESNLSTLSYVYCYQANGVLHIHYEDLNGLIDFKLNFKVNDDHTVSFFEEHTDENPIRFKLLANFFKDDKLQ